MSTIPGLFVIGEANFSDHGANRLGASALMQGLADGYFVLPYTINRYLNASGVSKLSSECSEAKNTVEQVKNQISKIFTVKGTQSPDSFHRRLGKIMWTHCGMARSSQSLTQALKEIPELRKEFWHDVRISGQANGFNQVLEKGLRVAEFLEFAELLCLDALERDESCGGHFREEHQTEEGEAQRNDEKFCHVAAWEYKEGKKPELHKEALHFEKVSLAVRSYK